MKLLVDHETPWWENTECNPKQTKEQIQARDAMTLHQKSSLKARTSTLYQEQVQKYRKNADIPDSDRAWLATVMKEGTQSDKISAMLLQTQQAPFWSLDWILALLKMGSSTSRHESYPALEALKDIFCSIIPPHPNPALIPWSQQCLTDDKSLTSTRTLLLCYFQDILLSCFTEFLKLLEIILQDQVENGRERSMRIILDLLLAHPTQSKSVLISLLVNKLGDPSRKLASRTLFYLQQVTEKHPSLTLDISREVQRVVLSDHVNDKPVYYGLTFMSQIRLSKGNSEVTQCLLSTFQHFLQKFINSLEPQPTGSSKAKDAPKNAAKKASRKPGKAKKAYEEIELTDDNIPRYLKVTLLGLSRALPFATSLSANGLSSFLKHLLSIATKIRSFPTLLQAISLIFNIFTVDAAGIEESYLPMIRDLVCQQLLDYNRFSSCTSLHSQLFKLLLRITDAVPATAKGLECIRSIVKATLSVSCLVARPAFCAAALLLVNRLILLHPSLKLALVFPEEEEDAIVDPKENASSQLFWEILYLSKHYHPTVARYSRIILSQSSIDVSKEPEDPFVFLTDSLFLTKFIEGNVKMANP